MAFSWFQDHQDLVLTFYILIYRPQSFQLYFYRLNPTILLFPNIVSVLTDHQPLLLILTAFLRTLPDSKLSRFLRNKARNSVHIQMGTQDGSIHIFSLAACIIPKDTSVPLALWPAEALCSPCFPGLHWYLGAHHLLSQGLVLYFLL